MTYKKSVVALQPDPATQRGLPDLARAPPSRRNDAARGRGRPRHRQSARTDCPISVPFRRGPLRTLSDVELITADYVPWFKQQRLSTASAAFHPPKPSLATMPTSVTRPTGRLAEPRGCVKPGTLQHPVRA